MTTAMQFQGVNAFGEPFVIYANEALLAGMILEPASDSQLMLLPRLSMVGTLTKDTTPTRPAPLISTTHTRRWTF